MGVLIPVFVIVLIVAIFSVQNAAPVAITFLFWQFQASLAIVIFLCVLAGIAIGVIGSFLAKMKRPRKATKQTGIEGPRPG